MHTFPFSVGDVLSATVVRAEVYGLWLEYEGHKMLLKIPDTSWIASFNSCRQFAAPGDRLDVKVLAIDRESGAVSASHKLLYPEVHPLDAESRLSFEEVIEARVVRYVEEADRCDGRPSYLVEVRPGAYCMLCAHYLDAELEVGSYVRVWVERMTATRRGYGDVWVSPAGKSAA